MRGIGYLLASVILAQSMMPLSRVTPPVTGSATSIQPVAFLPLVSQGPYQTLAVGTITAQGGSVQLTAEQGTLKIDFPPGVITPTMAITVSASPTDVETLALFNIDATQLVFKKPVTISLQLPAGAPVISRSVLYLGSIVTPTMLPTQVDTANRILTATLHLLDDGSGLPLMRAAHASGSGSSVGAANLTCVRMLSAAQDARNALITDTTVLNAVVAAHNLKTFEAKCGGEPNYDSFTNQMLVQAQTKYAEATIDLNGTNPTNIDQLTAALKRMMSWCAQLHQLNLNDCPQDNSTLIDSKLNQLFNTLEQRIESDQALDVLEHDTNSVIYLLADEQALGLANNESALYDLVTKGLWNMVRATAMECIPQINLWWLAGLIQSAEAGDIEPVLQMLLQCNVNFSVQTIDSVDALEPSATAISYTYMMTPATLISYTMTPASINGFNEGILVLSGYANSLRCSRVAGQYANDTFSLRANGVKIKQFETDAGVTNFDTVITMTEVLQQLGLPTNADASLNLKLWREGMVLDCEDEGITSTIDIVDTPIYNLNLHVKAKSITVSPTGVTLEPGQQQQFTATVKGYVTTTVAWWTDGGTITPAGLYTAGEIGGTYIAIATSDADPALQGSADITLTAPADVPVLGSSRHSNIHLTCGNEIDQNYFSFVTTTVDIYDVNQAAPGGDARSVLTSTFDFNSSNIVLRGLHDVAKATASVACFAYSRTYVEFIVEQSVNYRLKGSIAVAGSGVRASNLQLARLNPNPVALFTAAVGHETIGDPLFDVTGVLPPGTYYLDTVSNVGINEEEGGSGSSQRDVQLTFTPIVNVR